MQLVALPFILYILPCARMCEKSNWVPSTLRSKELYFGNDPHFRTYILTGEKLSIRIEILAFSRWWMKLNSSLLTHGQSKGCNPCWHFNLAKPSFALLFHLSRIYKHWEFPNVTVNSKILQPSQGARVVHLYEENIQRYKPSYQVKVQVKRLLWENLHPSSGF